jgi:hypothetical protein
VTCDPIIRDAVGFGLSRAKSGEAGWRSAEFAYPWAAGRAGLDLSSLVKVEGPVLGDLGRASPEEEAALLKWVKITDEDYKRCRDGNSFGLERVA